MLFLMVLLIFYSTTGATSIKSFGSAIFDGSKFKLPCWSQTDIAKLKARKAFEELIPPPVSLEVVNSRYIKHTLRYFKQALATVQYNVDRQTALILRTALLDTFGAHLKGEILPTIRFAYYAGYVSYKNAKEIQEFYDNILIDLNTKGIGWRKPKRIPQWSNLTVAKILIGSGKLLDPCSCLVTKSDSNNCIHLPPPKVDNEADPSAIALPFKTESLVSLLVPSSENILIKYYTTAARCILHSSPGSCRHSDFVNFNSELWHWMKRDVAPHLMDEKLYTAFGGVLRIAAAVQNYGKGLSRRNLFEYQAAAGSPWNPWKTLSQSYIYVNKDWNPSLYICLVLLIAVAICLLQICYNYTIGNTNMCRCKGAEENLPACKEVAYTKMDSNFPAVLPQQNTVYYTEQPQIETIASKSKSSSARSMHTQKVYDLNENTNKFMAVIESDNESIIEVGSSTSRDSDDEGGVKSFTSPKENDIRAKSPPKLETPVAQMKIEKTQPRLDNNASVPTYSTRSEATFCPRQRLSESDLSVTGSTTSDKTASSTSSRSRTSRSSRNLAWAHRVMSRHKRRVQRSTSGTEQDGTSFTTPPQSRQR